MSVKVQHRRLGGFGDPGHPKKGATALGDAWPRVSGGFFRCFRMDDYRGGGSKFHPFNLETCEKTPPEYFVLMTIDVSNICCLFIPSN